MQINFAWDHADKIDKVGVFSGSFWYRDKDASDPNYSDDNNRIIINKIRSSRKKPHLKYWFYAGGNVFMIYISSEDIFVFFNFKGYVKQEGSKKKPF